MSWALKITCWNPWFNFYFIHWVSRNHLGACTHVVHTNTCPIWTHECMWTYTCTQVNICIHKILRKYILKRTKKKKSKIKAKSNKQTGKIYQIWTNDYHQYHVQLDDVVSKLFPFPFFFFHYNKITTGNLGKFKNYLSLCVWDSNIWFYNYFQENIEFMM
jgi:hypothetical protein